MISVDIQYPQKVREHPYHFLDSSIWNEFKFRDDDIIIGTYSKSGTTWVQQIVTQLLWQGAEDINVAAISPWIDSALWTERNGWRCLRLKRIVVFKKRTCLLTHWSFRRKPNIFTLAGMAATCCGVYTTIIGI